MKIQKSTRILRSALAVSILAAVSVAAVGATPANAVTTCSTLGVCAPPTTKVAGTPDPVTNLKVTNVNGMANYSWTNPMNTGNYPLDWIRVTEIEVGPAPCDPGTYSYTSLIGSSDLLKPGHVDSFSGRFIYSNKCYLHVDVTVRNSAGQWSSTTVWQGFLP